MKLELDMSPEAVARRERLEKMIAGRSAPATHAAEPPGFLQRGGPAAFSISPVRTLDPESEVLLEEERHASRVKLWEKRCPARYREPFDMRKVADSVSRDALKKVLEWRYSDKGLYILGESGHSKTRAVYAMAGRVFIEDRRDVVTIDGIRFANEAAAAWGDCAQTEKWLKSLTEPDVLVIDDLAKKWTPSTEEAAFVILDRRSAWKRPTHITLNYTGEQLRQMSQDQLAVGPFLRRVKDYCEVIAF